MRKYFSLVKFSHTIFAMPFALIGFSLAIFYERQTFHWHLLFFMLLCMVFARNAAMGFNRYLDRKYDALNPRTAIRDIPAGKIEPRQALTFTVINCILFVLTCYFINSTCFYLSLLALFVVLFYSYTKRFTPFCHLVLGAGLALAPIGAFLVVTGYFHLLPLLFSFAVFTWVSGFDIIYALQDEAFDKQHKLHSIPTYMGTKGAMKVSRILHVFSALFVIAAGILAQFSYFYWIGVVLYLILLVYQHSLVQPADLSKVDGTFMTTNGIASVAFAIFTILDLII